MMNYLQHLEHNKNLSDNTLKTYANVLSQIPKKISEKSINELVVKLKSKYSNSSSRMILTILKSYLKYNGNTDLANKIYLPKKETIKLDIPVDEIEKAIEKSKNDPFEHAIITTLAYTGLRISELCNLTLSEYKKDPTQITIIGKGDKERLVFFSDKTQKAINEYIKVRNHASDYLFVSGYGRCYQKVIDRILKRYSKKLHPHAFRHFFATRLLNNGADILAVRDLLGHSSIITTQIYLNLSNNRLKEIYKLINIQNAIPKLVLE